MRTAPESSALGTNPRTAGFGEGPPVFGWVAAGGQDHGGRHSQGGQTCGDLEAVKIRQLHVEQDQVRLKLLRRRDRLVTVTGLADDVEALGLEQAPCARPE